MDIGIEEFFIIVCGVVNVRVDILVLVVILGSYLFKVDLKIKFVKLRGVKFFGMICFLVELGLSKEFEGIYIFLDLDLFLGSFVGFLFGLDDVILEISFIVNWVDVFSMVGVVREVVVFIGGKLSLLEIKVVLVFD